MRDEIIITKYDVEQYKREFLDRTVLVSSRVASQILSRSERTVHRLVGDGKLTAYAETPTASGRRFLASELREYVESLKVELDDLRR